MKALLEAFDSVVQKQAEEREADQRAVEARRHAQSWTRPLVWVGAAVILLVGAYLLVQRPVWVFPPPPTPESMAITEASLRIGLANAALHIVRFRQRNGRLPATLPEAGAHPSGIRYERTGETTYRLTSQSGPVRVVYRSSQTLPAFLGNSFEVLSRRPR